MFHVLMNWYKRRFSDPNAVTLFLLLLAGFAVIYFFGDLVGPILVALVLAYLLDWPDPAADASGLQPELECHSGALFVCWHHAVVADRSAARA